METNGNLNNETESEPQGPVPSQLNYGTIERDESSRITGPEPVAEQPKSISDMDEDELYDALKRDMAALSEITGTNYDEDLNEITPLKAETYKQLLFLEQYRMSELEPLLLNSCRQAGMEEHFVGMILPLFQAAGPDAPLAMDILDIIIRHAYQERNKPQQE